MPTVYDYLNTYARCHTKQANRLMHYVGVPMIILALIMFLNWFHITMGETPIISFSWLMIMAALLFYYRLHFKLALLITVLCIPMTKIGNMLAGSAPSESVGSVIIFLFIAGWVLQFMGHYIEQQKPAFMSGLIQLLIGPLFFVVELLEALGLKAYFLKPEKEEASISP